MTMFLALLLQDDLAADAAVGGLLALGGTMMLFMLALMVFAVITGWKLFTKAGQPGWASIVPIYNLIIIMKIVGRPAWWILLMMIPLVNIAIGIIVAIDLAKSFGQGGIFVLLMILGIGYILLAWGNYRYLGPAASQTPVPVIA